MAGRTNLSLGSDCLAKCVENTPDEAVPLRELIANLVTLLLWYEASPWIEDDDCSAVEATASTLVSSHGETPGPCMAALGQIAFMVRDDVCPVGDAGFCDKPNADDHETVSICCDLGVDPACADPSPDCAGGGSKFVPTGACNVTFGYRSNSTLEAYWQLLIGKVCAPVAPFACTPIALPPGVSPSEAAARALFFALRTAPHWYRQLFEHLAAFYACEYGSEAYLDVRDVLCNHLILDCDAPPPMLCGECGDARLDAGEACDGSVIPLTCQELGFSAGDLACTASCTLNTDGCILHAPTDGGAATDAATTTSASGTASVSDSATTSGGAENGDCACRGGASSSNLFEMLSLFAFGLTTWRCRRRRP
ncbi:hypothetical protein [Nannocystis sp. SCPEA4]|uniref:hypothetical protein n=1 Tax=Nannocystis sp. SCPEA4 TaxID=2996787 RepID=UPI00226E8885|nr:hypothetical protein [Nannocystis sp. SCPEA4]MCY1057440.1 hypothetical protein [Nannocystis sp. SCPEA4]